MIDVAAAASSLLSVVSAISKNSEGSAGQLKLLRVLRMLRVAKVARLGDESHLLSKLLPGFHLMNKLITIMGIIIVSAHVVSSIFILISNGAWLENYVEGSGIEWDDSWTVDSNNGRLQKYILSLYWGIITMTTVGYCPLPKDILSHTCSAGMAILCPLT